MSVEGDRVTFADPPCGCSSSASMWVQRSGMKAMEGADFRAEVARDPDIAKYLSAAEVQELFDLRHQLRYEDELFRRAFGGAGPAARGSASRNK